MSYYFSGNYDGRGYTISGLYTQAGSSSTYGYQGLFGYVRGQSRTNKAVIENVGIIDSHVQGYWRIGGVVGSASDYSTIINCYNAGSVTGSGENVGGVVGSASDSCTIINCYNAGSVTGSYRYTGGVVGYAHVYTYSSIDSFIIENCYNTGSVTGSSYVGGVVGYARFYKTTNCYNTASVEGGGYVGGVVGEASNSTITNCYNTASVEGGSWTGGVVGEASRYSYITNCYNTGSVSGSYDIGGVVGYAYDSSDIRNCYNTGSVTGSSNSVGGVVGYAYDSSDITNCYNTGSVEGSYDVGGVVGEVRESDITKCYYGGNCTLSYGIGGVYNSSGSSNQGTSKDNELVANAKSLSWYQDTSNWNSSYRWDFTDTWAIVEELNDGYPILRAFSNLITYVRNFGSNEIITSQMEPGVNEIAIEDYDIFSETGYQIIHWNTKANGSGIIYYPGDIYSTDSSLTLYAIWEPLVYTITLDWNGGVDNSSALGAMYIKYDTGIYSNSTATASLSSLSESNLPTRAGFTLLGFYTENNTSSICLISVTADSSGERTGTFSELLTTTYFIDHATLYAQWEVNYPAYYDADGDYWYVENGRMPQARVSSSLNRTLDSRWASLPNGATYSMGAFGGLVLTTKVYQNEEYYYNETLDDYYLVEPIKWRLTSNAGQTSGYGTDEDTYAIMDTIVYYGQYSTGAINSGDGYQITPVYYLKDNYIDSTFLVRETLSMPTFGGSGSLNSTSQTFTDNIFVSSREDILAVADTYSVKFSDLVTDLLADAGSVPLYYTRDLGTNLNHVYCLTPDGALLQYQPNRNKLGVQFTIKVSEYACVER